LETIVMSSAVASGLIVGVAVAGCVVLAVIMVASDDTKRQQMALFSRHINVLMVPLLMVFAYIVIIWGAKILTG
jgi:hypothetical protein